MKTKLKTKKAAAKRFKVTGTGKIKMRSSGMRHLLEHKRSNSKRNKRRALDLSPSDLNKVRAMMPGVC